MPILNVLSTSLQDTIPTALYTIKSTLVEMKHYRPGLIILNVGLGDVGEYS